MGLEWFASLQSIVDLIGKLIPRREMVPPTHRGFKFIGDKIIEFGVYSRSVGVIPGRNTVIWEVRKY